MTQMNTNRKFYCNFEQLKELEIFKKKVREINKYYSNTIQEYLFVKNKEDHTKYMFKNIKDIEDKLKKENKVEFIDNISTEYDYDLNTYFPTFKIFENLNKINFKINEGILHSNNKRKEGWGIVTIEINDSNDDNNDKKTEYSFTDFELLSLSIDENELKSFISMRDNYSLHEWIDILLYSLGYSSEFLTFKEKITLIARAIPFCEKNFSLLEIGSRGTGKSEFYKLFGNESVKSYNEPPSVAALFYNNNNKKYGYIKTKDVVIIDEVHEMKFDKNFSPMLKSYLDNGIFDRGKDSFSECSVVFLGNYDNLDKASSKPEKIIAELENNFFNDTAVLEKLNFISYGWEVQKYKKPLDSKKEKFLLSYLIKIFQKLKNIDFNDLIEERIEFNKHLPEREKKKIIKTVSGLLKLLHPNKKVRDKELIAYLLIAVENEEYKLNLKRHIENPDNLNDKKGKSEFKLPSPIFIPKNENYKDNIYTIKKEFILYNYIDLFKSNYSLKDFIPIAKEFELDNGSNTSINFFPINNTNLENKEAKLIGDTLIIEHPYYSNEMLNIAISLTGIQENKSKVEFYKFSNLPKTNLFSLTPLEELGEYSENYLLLSSKRNSTNKNTDFKITILNKDSLFKNNQIIPYYTKNIYSSPDFQLNTIANNFGSGYYNHYIHYSYFKIIKSINPMININSLKYLIKEEIYEIEYSEILAAPSPNKYNKNTQTQPIFTPKQSKKLNINELIDLLEAKN